ncbi:MAG TPA: flagellar basal body rod protein FlgC [Candidatus Hydrogenedentes bacterium]|nr:flagellar basal body rod protein FlgC [Candidatus Hydrogenedentota bacterium]
MLEAISAREIAVSGLKAQRTRMNLIANNIANAMTPTTAKGGAFRRQLAILSGESVQSGIAPEKLGVKVERVMSDPSPLRQVYEPGNPYANADGYVEYPNVDMAVEMADLVSAQRAYEANIAVLVSGRRMTAKALEIIQV